MPKVTYISPNEVQTVVDVPVGMTLMHGALLNNVPGLLAECGGAMLCATCHIYLDLETANKIAMPSDLEREKLAKVNQRKSTSRLSCQIKMTDELDGIIVQLPESQVWA